MNHLIRWALRDPFVESYRPRRFDVDSFNPWDVSRELRNLARLPEFLRKPIEGPGAEVIVDKDKFQLNVDVQQFAPNEVTVKASNDNTITIEGKHEERADEHGYVARHFVRKYVLPEGHDVNQVVSNLSSDGVLTITAPKTDKSGVEQKNIPITQTGVPLKAVEDKSK